MNEDTEAENEFFTIVQCLRFGQLLVYESYGKFSAAVMVGDEAWHLTYGTGDTILAAIRDLNNLLSGYENEPSR